MLTASSALALDIYFDQVTGVAGGALGIVGGPVGGFVGGMLGRQIGRKIHPRPRAIDNSDLESRAHVTPIYAGRVIQDGEGQEDRTVDSTPVRMIEPAPSAMDARTYMASATAKPSEAVRPHTYRIVHRHRVEGPETYLVSAPPPGERAAPAEARAIPVSVTTGEAAAVEPGTLGYQLKQLNARRAAEGAPRIQTVADLH
jgi:hypothetical protein